VIFELELTRASGGSIEVKETASLQDSIENGGGQILVVKYPIRDTGVGSRYCRK
jgi:hypothetical protein